MKAELKKMFTQRMVEMRNWWLEKMMEVQTITVLNQNKH